MPGYFDLNNRVALVTGASRGLGLAMAEALAEVGATVILNGREIEGRTIDRFKQHPRSNFQAALQGPRQDDGCGHGNEAFSVSICYEPLLRFGNRFLIALLEHRFEFFFERARRNSELAKRWQVS
jgi:NAD(P)-dependent dehydrogenase (short-subunit alcohol dehydrogenase family)